MHNVTESQDNGKDLSARRVIKTDGNEIFVERHDPYGFWTIRYKNGTMPETLKGQYTRAEYAIRAVNHYLELKAKEPYKIKPKPGVKSPNAKTA